VRAVVVSVLAVALATSASAPAEPAGPRPALRIIDLAPLTVRGERFKPHERVKLLVNAGRPFTRKVKAGERGRFVAKLGVRVTSPCTDVVVQAIGGRGSRATAERLKPPGCDVRP
jgi:hypothetical protein